MICEIVRGLICFALVAERTQEIADKAGFSCDEAPCFRDRDNEDNDENDEAIVIKTEAVKDPDPVTTAEPEKKKAPAKKSEPEKKKAAAKKTAPKKEEKKEDKKEEKK